MTLWTQLSQPGLRSGDLCHTNGQLHLSSAWDELSPHGLVLSWAGVLAEACLGSESFVLPPGWGGAAPPPLPSLAGQEQKRKAVSFC